MPAPFLTAKGLSKTYRGRFGRPDVQALKQLDLEVEGGEIFGLLGPNGAGKTTFIKLMLGLADATAGRAMLMGIPVSDWRARKPVGYLPENHRFPEFLTARQMLSLYGQMSGRRPSKHDVQIDELLDLVGMTGWGDVRIGKYSKGMMQRVGLAQALLGDPSIVFLDEPTDGVDPIGRREIRNVLLHLKAKGKTVFVNSHLLSELEMVCSRVAIINRGTLVREGTLAELLSDSDSHILVSTQIPQSVLDEIPEISIRNDSPSPTGQHANNPVTVSATVGRDAMVYSVGCGSRTRRNEIIDALRSAGVEIEDFKRTVGSLEDLFVRSVTEADTANLGPGSPSDRTNS